MLHVQNIEAETQWSTLGRRHFQTYFPIPELLYFDSISLNFVSKIAINNKPAFRYNEEATSQSMHYDDVIMGAIASQITSLTIVYSTVYSGADQSRHQSSASLAFVWKWPVTRKMFPFDDVIMWWLCLRTYIYMIYAFSLDDLRDWCHSRVNKINVFLDTSNPELSRWSFLPVVCGARVSYPPAELSLFRKYPRS